MSQPTRIRFAAAACLVAVLAARPLAAQSNGDGTRGLRTLTPDGRD